MPKPDPNAARRRWMAVLARATAAELEAGLAAAGVPHGFQRLRGPETGLAMLRGRAGGGGGAFNLGEMTVTRCTVRDADGHVGHAVVAGRDRRVAELAALLDAALQDPARQDAIERDIIAPLSDRQQAMREAAARRAAATKVAFFTLATMRA